MTTSFYLTPRTDDGEFSMALGQTLAAFLPWYRWLIPTKPGPGTDTCCFPILVQMAHSNQTRPWDRHLLLYCPGTDTDYFTTLVQPFHPAATIAAQLRAAACDVTGVVASLILILQSCKFLNVILGAQVTQICSMDILRLTIDFIKMSKIWFLSMEFYGTWQLRAIKLHT